jgi:hypothetical protein
MSSPFGNKKKARKRYRRKAQQQIAWADQHAVSGKRALWNTDAMRQLAEHNLRSALRRRRKPPRPKAAG